MKNTIKITIEGHAGSGKTILANVIKDFVVKHGLKCKINDLEESKYKGARPRNWKSKFKHVKRYNDLVDIDIVQPIYTTEEIRNNHEKHFRK